MHGFLSRLGLITTGKPLLLALATLCVAAFSSAALAADVENIVPRQRQGDGSWIALLIVISSVLTAWLMNYSAPRVRAFGTLLAALGCFAVVAWFAEAVGTGIIENPKPIQTPMDSAKPVLLWMQISVAFVTGLVLLLVTYGQSKNTETLILPAKNEPERYGRVSRVIHWTTAILFITLIPMGIFASMIPLDADFRLQYYVVHETIGVLVFALLIFRLLWNKHSKRPQLAESLKPSEHKLAHRAHIALYVMMIAIPLTGYVMTSFHGFPTLFFAWDLQPLWGESEAYLIWGLFHKYILPYLLYIVLGAHILGALKHHFLDKHEAAFKRMVG
jgi:cytochrome b561